MAAAAITAADGEDRLDVGLKDKPVGRGLNPRIDSSDRRDAGAEQQDPQGRGDASLLAVGPSGTAVVGGRGHRRSNSPRNRTF